MMGVTQRHNSCVSHIDYEAVEVAHGSALWGGRQLQKSIAHQKSPLENDGALDVPSSPMLVTAALAVALLICKKTLGALSRRGST